MIGEKFSGKGTVVSTNVGPQGGVLAELYISNLGGAATTVEIKDSKIDFNIPVPANDVTTFKPAGGMRVEGQLVIVPAAAVDWFAGFE